MHTKLDTPIKHIFIELDGVLNIKSALYDSRVDSGKLAEPYQLYLLNEALSKIQAKVIFICPDNDDILLELSQLGFSHLDKVQGSVFIQPEEYVDYITAYKEQNSCECLLVHSSDITNCSGNAIAINPELGLTPKETYILKSDSLGCL